MCCVAVCENADRRERASVGIVSLVAQDRIRVHDVSAGELILYLSLCEPGDRPSGRNFIDPEDLRVQMDTSKKDAESKRGD